MTRLQLPFFVTAAMQSVMLQKGKPSGPRPTFVQEVKTRLDQAVQFDVIMCGGTLGIFLACCLQLKGLRCAQLPHTLTCSPGLLNAQV